MIEGYEGYDFLILNFDLFWLDIRFVLFGMLFI